MFEEVHDDDGEQQPQEVGHEAGVEIHTAVLLPAVTHHQ